MQRSLPSVCARRPLVSRATFDAVQAAFGTRKGASTRTPKTHRHYLLAGRMRCAVCGRRMQGHWTHGRAYYRCKFTEDYPAGDCGHPRNVYVREDAVVRGLDRWVASLFDDDHIDDTCDRLAGVSEPDPAAQEREAALRAAIADCDRKLANYRSLLDHEDAVTVAASWIADTQRERKNLERQLGQHVPGDQLTREQVKALVNALTGHRRGARRGGAAGQDRAVRPTRHLTGLRPRRNRHRRVTTPWVNRTCRRGDYPGQILGRCPDLPRIYLHFAHFLDRREPSRDGHSGLLRLAQPYQSPIRPDPAAEDAFHARHVEARGEVVQFAREHGSIDRTGLETVRDLVDNTVNDSPISVEHRGPREQRPRWRTGHRLLRQRETRLVDGLHRRDAAKPGRRAEFECRGPSRSAVWRPAGDAHWRPPPR